MLASIICLVLGRNQKNISNYIERAGCRAGLSYIVNQNAPTRRPRLFISVVMWMMFRDTLTHAAAQAYDLSSIVLPVHCLLDT